MTGDLNIKFERLKKILSEMDSCAPGISVGNVDNGFGAGYMAGLFNRINEVD